MLPKLSLSYAATPETRFYGPVQGGYRAGGAGASIITARDFTFNPEKTWNMDLGVRHRSDDGRLRVSANLFYVNWQDQQLQVPCDTAKYSECVGTETIDLVSVNAGQAESYGSEFEMDYQATQRLRLFSTVGLLKTRIKGVSDSQSQEQEWVGNSFTMAPMATVSAGFHYDFDHGLDFSLAANWRDKFFSDIENTAAEVVDGRLLVDMGIGYEFTDRDLRLDFKVTNLFDAKYINHSYIDPIKGLAQRFNSLSGGSAPFLGVQDPPLIDTDGIVSPGPGRAVILSLTGRF